MKKILVIILMLTLVLSFSLSTAMADDGKTIPYKKVTKINSQEELNQLDDANVKENIKTIGKIKNMKFVGATIQEQYVAETVDESGNIIGSKLMTNTEVADYQTKLVSNASASVMASSAIGSDQETYAKLTIYLTVYENSDGTYQAYSSADWVNTSTGTGGSDWPATGLDFISLTWGGGGELKTVSKAASGYYQFSQGSISFSRAQSDSYSGYCWQFNDIKPALLTNYYADVINANVKIKKTYSTVQNKETNVKFTYIHTYQSTTGSISISGGTSGAAAGISLSSTPNKWQIEIDVPGVKY